MNRVMFLFLSMLLSLTACSVANTVQVKGTIAPGEKFITTGGISLPYDSLGMVQVSKQGMVCVGGFLPIVKATLKEGFNEVLVAEMEQRGADGIINVNFQELQMPLGARIPFIFPFFFVPLPEAVMITGELVKLK